MQTRFNDPLVSCDWLAAHLDDPELAVLDATFFLPMQGRDALQDYRAEHLPGAQFYDIDAIADHSSALPHMQPSPEFFAESVGRLGIGNSKQVVLYDNNSFLASARVWWTFRLFGHKRVSVLDGGLKRWKADRRPLVSGPAETAPLREFRAVFRPELVCPLDQIREISGNPTVAIVDARSPGRFAGTDPEPRAGLRSGHIPGSVNLFYRRLVDDSSGLMKTPPEIDAECRAAGVDPAQSIVTTCGTGVTAAILALGLFRLGREDIAVYDGSWAEWGGRGDV